MEIDEANYEIVSASNINSASEDCLKRNYVDISNAAVASVRFGVSSHATAALINGFMADLVKETRHM